MSMSQEEIEALMNGLDIADEPAQDSQAEEISENTDVNTDEIEELISQNEDLSENVENVDISNEIVDNSDIDQLLKDLESSPSVEDPLSNEDDFSALNEDMKELTSESIEEESFDDILADIDGIVETKNVKEEVVITPSSASINEESLVKDWTDSKISEGVFPLPADKDTKVVNQLSEVANDSEEKAGQIFDVLSLCLDNNNDVRTKVSSIETYLNSQVELLNSLHNKFPNIDIFNTHLTSTQNVLTTVNEINTGINDEDMKIFEAMELMQFNDINRQKIERVMSVIRKLSIYLNNLFEDDHSHKEIAVAKHIHGDANETVDADDIEKLIEAYEK